MPGPTWNEKLELSDESFSIAEDKGYFENITKTHLKTTNNQSINPNICQQVWNKVILKIPLDNVVNS